jgi:uncharacterized protein (TIGR02118 family)
MIKVMILYPNANDNWFDKNYYMNKHIPLLQNCLGPYGLENFEFETGVAGLNGPAPFIATGILTFSTIDQFQKGMEAEGKTLMDDIPNYTRDFVVQVGETVNILQEA